MTKECMTSTNGLRTIEHITGLLRQRAMTVADLHEAMQGSYSRIMAFVTYMRRHQELHGPIHIESWHRRHDNKGKSMARYRYGPGEDAPTPTKSRRVATAKALLTDDEMDAEIDRRFKEAAKRRQAKHPIQRHWMDVALYGPAKNTQQHENRSST